MTDGLVSALVIGVLGLFAWLLRRRGYVVRHRSQYSQIFVRDEGPFRLLYFLSTGGDRDLESAMDRRRPNRLVLGYCRMMMVGLVFVPRVRRCLILGLGGASLVKFMEGTFPETQVDVVEIDPDVERIAREHFAWIRRDDTRVFLEDAAEYLRRTADRYDIIFVDAFLPRSAETDSMGIPLRLKDRGFYEQLRQHTERDGVVVFNMNRSLHIEDDVYCVGEVFPATYRFAIPGTHNEVMVALNAASNAASNVALNVERGMHELLARARCLNDRAIPEMDFVSLLACLKP